ncbi:LysR family transcriptional regulator [Serratia liquefaciens]|uniref:LysR family transcriptional regulator n=1 Tax=Serratia liquefaciens TaxID=614 RepID=A0A515D5Y8_SERLI|nr:LysR family transcriptional regulator [Serratia liquefaciens]QDL35808.1 LysR family transcriptional regulator [Serratia liquefaciens]
MIDRTNHLIGDWLIYIRVLDCKSFSAAADTLNRSVSAVSKSVAKLENTLNTQLIRRDARNFEITPAGQVTYEKAQEICRAYRELVTELQNPSSQIQGTLRILCPTVLSDSIIPSWIMDYTNSNPMAVINIQSREGGSFSTSSLKFDDLVIKSGYMDSPDLVHKKINPVPFGIYASPDYLSSRQIVHPDELVACSILKLQHPSLSGPLTLMGKDGDSVHIAETQPIFSSNNIGSLIQMATEGGGICIALPTWTVKQHLEDGRLQTVLPEWTLPELPSYLVWRYRSNYSMLFSDFISFIENKWNHFFSL